MEKRTKEKNLLKRSDIRVVRTESMERLKRTIDGNDTLPLHKDDQNDLIKRAHSGDERAMNEILKTNSRFVYSVVCGMGVYDDFLGELYSAGMEGMMEAVKRFDVSSGVKFITYAVWWIRKYAKERMEDIGVVRTNNFVTRVSFFAKNWSNKFFLMNGREPSQEEIMEAVCEKFGRDVPESCLTNTMGLSISGRVEFSDGSVSDEPEWFDDETACDNTVIDLIEMEKMRHDIESLLSKLPDRDADIVRKSFGVCGETEKSVFEISIEEKISETSVRRSLNRSVDRMKSVAGVK